LTNNESKTIFVKWYYRNKSRLNEEYLRIKYSWNGLKNIKYGKEAFRKYGVLSINNKIIGNAEVVYKRAFRRFQS
jgi:hypothetical protein